MEAMIPESTDAPVLLGDYVPTADNRVVLHGVDWQGYEALLAMRGEHRRPRLTYLDGAVELMTTSEHHERIKYVFGRLLERYLIALGTRYTAYGQTTYKRKHLKAGLEADDCYVLGEPRGATGRILHSRLSGPVVGSRNSTFTNRWRFPRCGCGSAATCRSSSSVPTAMPPLRAAPCYRRSIWSF